MAAASALSTRFGRLRKALCEHTVCPSHSRRRRLAGLGCGAEWHGKLVSIDGCVAMPRFRTVSKVRRGVWNRGAVGADAVVEAAGTGLALDPAAGLKTWHLGQR